MRPCKRGSGNLMYYFWVYSLFYRGKDFFFCITNFSGLIDPFCFLANYFLMDTSFRQGMRCF